MQRKERLWLHLSGHMSWTFRKHKLTEYQCNVLLVQPNMEVGQMGCTTIFLGDCQAFWLLLMLVKYSWPFFQSRIRAPWSNQNVNCKQIFQCNSLQGMGKYRHSKWVPPCGNPQGKGRAVWESIYMVLLYQICNSHHVQNAWDHTLCVAISEYYSFCVFWLFPEKNVRKL